MHPLRKLLLKLGGPEYLKQKLYNACGNPNAKAECISDLILAGVDVNVTWNGYNALHLCMMNSDVTIQKITALVDGGIDLELPYGPEKIPPLSWFVGADLFDIAVLLAERGANVNAADSAGLTALHMAASPSRRPFVRLLLDNNARTDLKDIRGNTALDFARAYGCQDTINEILGHKCSTPSREAALHVAFQRDEHKAHPAAPHIQITKKIYSAQSKEAAIKFMSTQKVSEPFYYIEIETPEGRFGIDNGERIYDNKGNFIEAEPEPKNVPYDTETKKMMSELECDRPDRRRTPPDILAQGEAALRCLRAIIEDASADFFMRRLAVWWGSQFNNAGFNQFLRQRFVEGKDRVKLYQKAESSQADVAKAEEGLHIAATDVLSGNWKP